MQRNYLLIFKSILFSTLAVLALANTDVAKPITESGTIKGVVTATTLQDSTPVSGARLSLTNSATPNQPYTTESNDAGEYIFTSLPAGTYVLLTETAGQRSIIRDIKLAGGMVLTIDVNLSVSIGESVDVRTEEGLLSTSETSVSNVIRSETLKTEPFRDDNFQNSIALTPGVVRDARNRNYLKGTRPGQSGYKVNGADVTDPVTGEVAFEIPLEAASTVEVEESPYSAEFGQFTGGVTNLQTKGGGEKFKFAAARLFPTFRNVLSTKVDSFRPRVTVSGPLVKDKLFFLQSFEYRFRRDKVTSLPKPFNNITTESFNAFTQIDWNINASNSAKFNFAVFPSKVRNLNLDTFNPVEATPNYKQRGLLFSFSEQSIFENASFLSSDFSYKTFDVDVFAKSTNPFSITPEFSQGGYFGDTRRRSARWQWRETYYFRPFKALGDHSVKTGFEVFSTAVKGNLNYAPILIRRFDGSLARRVGFQNGARFEQTYDETGLLIQDRWVINPKITLDFGGRFDRDGLTGQNNFSPRFSVLYSPGTQGKTVIRGGIGIFYDRTSPIGGTFEDEIEGGSEIYLPNIFQIPRRTITDYALDGTTIVGGPTSFVPQIDGVIRTPRSVRWSLQVDQAVTDELTMRFGYLRRKLTKDLIFDPLIGAGNNGSILISSRGRSTYDELQFVATYDKPGFGNWNASYVLSRSEGDLNTADKIYSDLPDAILRRNHYGPLAFDSTHRFLAYGQLDFKYDIRVAPLVEFRTGFPYSAVNERLEYVGAPNRSGRFPNYFSLDFQITKAVKLPFFDKKKARVGIALFNLTNHFNPRDVQTNLTSPNFGGFYNSLGTEIKAKFDFDF